MFCESKNLIKEISSKELMCRDLVAEFLPTAPLWLLFVRHHLMCSEKHNARSGEA